MGVILYVYETDGLHGGGAIVKRLQQILDAGFRAIQAVGVWRINELQKSEQRT